MSVPKKRRSTRMIELTRAFLESPNTLFSLTEWADTYGSAKSSLSEDVAMIKTTFETQGIGTVVTFAGAQGGVMYVPSMAFSQAHSLVVSLIQKVEDPSRILPGGYVYLTDLLGDPYVLRQIGRLVAALFPAHTFDVIMTVETKGIPLAYAASYALNRRVVIARRDSQITEGSLVTINYVSGSNRHIQTMSLSRRMVPEGARVLIIDDFLRGGGTLKGMSDLLKEFRATPIGAFVLMEAESEGVRLYDDHISLLRLNMLDDTHQTLKVEAGNVFSRWKAEADYDRL
ncbi:MAG: pur operon repressor [Candidatus Carbobacillus altaicus]|uniref:PurR: transcription regulator associated with purine metabolism n=1 Tax=Candidatus Carbonibacillus altaicus TaxID=2163959 RepID=A0A2R6Y1N0_9BACL|nr:pur operon repressor [Candidatus Carbobacillus altaicus]PTQ56586.1 MAG: PurR: transcription regulator associated with purine metabolism [Candidatus Carbobacillus altaicus]